LNRHVLTYGPFQLEYQVIGNPSKSESPRAWLAFHGFGRDAKDFAMFEGLMEDRDVIYSFNLFQHGLSVFPSERLKNQPMTLDEHKGLIDFILDHFNLDRFSLLGYSMGGKIALKTVESHAEQIQSMLLIAPDGVKLNPWYKFASGTMIGRNLYRALTRHPWPLFRVADFSKFTGIITPKIHRFVYNHMDSFEKRRQVGETWLIYREFHPELALVQENINTHNIPIHLIYGRYDSVIQPWQGQKLDEGLDQNALHLLEQGHLLLNDKTLNYIRENGLWG
jgi:pimeloyl-ACP methyl ester carboxylesterase